MVGKSAKPKLTVRLSRKKKALYSLITLLVMCLALESGTRAYFAFKVGPSVLLYGTGYERQQISPPSPATTQQAWTRPEAKTHMSTMTSEEWNESQNVVVHSNRLSGYSKYFPHQKRVDFDIETGDRFDVTINRRGFRDGIFLIRRNPA